MKWIDRTEVNRQIIEMHCPGDFIIGAPEIDFATEADDENEMGCRGITCVECWNTESEEE
jgi:hypothetical protein